MNNDLISREALKKKIKADIDMGDNACDIGYLNAMEMCVEYIDNASTVEITEEQAIDKLHETGWLPRHDKEMTERPKGEWIECEEWYETYYECSVCKEPWCTFEGTPVDNLMNYCPCCGAKMQGVRKNEEEGEEE